MEKSLVIFPAGKSRKKTFFGVLVWEKEIIFQTWSFDMHSDNILFWYFDKIDNLTFIVLTVTVPVFGLGVSFGKVKSGKSLEKVKKKSGNLYSKMRRNLEGVFISEFWYTFY